MRGDDAYAILKKKMQDMQGEKIQESVNRYFDEHPVQAGATADRNLQTWKTDWIDSLFDQFHCLFIKAVILMF